MEKVTPAPAPAPAPRQRGTSLIEVLVTMVIIAIGLLGLASLQSNLQVNDVESYQRAQAAILLKDMSSRLAANRHMRLNYVQNNIGSAACPVTTNASTRAQLDLAQWCRSLRGAAERQGASEVGAMVGARGCITAINANTYLVSVAWQGLVPVSAPPVGLPCGANQYDGAAGSSCIADRCRRVIGAVVQVGNL
ncbi:MAG TPA: prepilin-type N-terminal cleavage/methylation domain-containing protein [Solimonas sp.]|nr:prepilin-type N-terminal cleavage/methylation domain-containing protein [Solimonas sp.]